MLHGVPHFFENIERAAQLYGVPCEMFSSGAEISRRFPAFQVQPSDAALLDLWGGYVFPEGCIRTQRPLTPPSHPTRSVGERARTVSTP